MKYYLIAGEASGDLHGSLLMTAMAAKDPQAQFRYWGGGKMDAACSNMSTPALGRKVRDIRDTAVMGIVEVLSKARKVRRADPETRRRMADSSPLGVSL